jgi:hypothetical protein
MTAKGQKWRELLSPYVYLSSNWISRVGVVFVTTAFVLWLYLLPTFIRGEVTHPYAGILIFLFLPAAFVIGLLLIPVGIVLRARRDRRRGTYPTDFVPLDFHNPDFRRLLAFIGIVTIVNVLVGSQLVYSGVNYMDTVTFCGETCHTVMQPEYTAYLHSPHARVACVQCHIGPGASWFVRSKLSGLKQVFAVLLNTYPRPIPSPVTSLRPARATCEQCHWPSRFEGNRLVVIPRYAEDQANTLTYDVLLMHIGGGEGNQGIHGAHVGPGVTIRYGSDASRQKMYWVEYENSRTGKKALYVAPGVNPKSINPRRGRVMDCIDCHNRPTHIFYMPGQAMNRAMAAGKISPSLPYIKKEGVALLKQPYSSRAQAARRIPAELTAYYQANFPAVANQNAAEIASAAGALVTIYGRNVFPKMRVTWGTYPNNLGHKYFPGCFRCHGTLHNPSVTYEKIPRHCGMCHAVLAQDEAHPKILDELGLTDPSSSSPGP